MKKEIENRIIELGGVCNFQGKSLKDDLLSISFAKQILSAGSFDFDDYKTLYHKESCNFRKALAKKGFVTEEEFASMDLGYYFTFYISLYDGDEDNEEYDDEIVDTTIRLSIGGNCVEIDASEYMSIGQADDYVVMAYTGDENPDNPSVYFSYIQDIFSDTPHEASDTFLGFLNSLLTPAEYKLAIEEYAKKHNIPLAKE